MADIYDNIQKKDPPNKENIAFPAVGSILSFANIDWRVLAVEDDKALLISDKILEKRKYNNGFTLGMTWEKCTLRKYLNGEFYNSLGEDKSKIAETKNSNPGNQWYKTHGGNATTDKIFLLGIEEAVKYFGDSGQLNNRPTIISNFIDDKYNSARTAKYKNEASWWWLRSPGGNTNFAARVYDDGRVFVFGNFVAYDYGGVRPAMWVNR